MATIRGFWFMSNNLTGTDENDDMFGAGFADIMRGGKLNDTMSGGGGDDQMFGDEGNDTMFGDEGNDTLHGGDQNDRLDGGKGDDDLFGDADQDTFLDIHGNNAINGGSGTDTVDYSGFFGGHVKVTLTDSGRGSAIREDLIRSVGGGSHFEEDSRDSLVSIENVVGTSGDDVITGNSANNVLRGGAGLDVMSGGGGADTFQFREGDLSQFAGERITDFDSFDRIDLLNIDAQTDVAGNNAFQVITGSGGFTGNSGELLIRSMGNGNFNVFGDTDGDRTADIFFAVHENVPGAFSANDFLL